ncbi:hypothetical protein [Nitrosomonas aestuarii]|nr:hypothetical protein [Nitrosomonas aestuarii]
MIIMLWLPLQSTTAAVISLCAAEKEREVIKQAALTSGNVISLPCAQEKHSSGGNGKTIMATVSDQHHTHKPLIQEISDKTVSNLQCNDVLCQINYTTLVLSIVDPISFSSSGYVPSFASGFVSFVPEQMQRPPIS